MWSSAPVVKAFSITARPMPEPPPTTTTVEFRTMRNSYTTGSSVSGAAHDDVFEQLRLLDRRPAGYCRALRLSVDVSGRPGALRIGGTTRRAARAGTACNGGSLAGNMKLGRKGSSPKPRQAGLQSNDCQPRLLRQGSAKDD